MAKKKQTDNLHDLCGSLWKDEDGELISLIQVGYGIYQFIHLEGANRIAEDKFDHLKDIKKFRKFVLDNNLRKTVGTTATLLTPAFKVLYG